MSQARLSILGLYNYIGDDLFKNLSLPSGIDRETLINNILLRGADFECLYPDAEFLQFAIGTWSKKWQRTFEKWVEALAIEYNPLDNYDRIEEWTDTSDKKNTGTVGIIDSNTSRTNSTSTNTVSAFDSSAFENDSRIVSDGDTTANGSNTRTDNLKEENQNIHKGRIHGNIGVTTSMQLLKDQLSIVEWNLYEKITDIFVNEFCIMIY